MRNMKIAVISDIHGNCLALETALADLAEHPADQIVCLGDAVQGGAQPSQTVARLRDLGCPIVMGNADNWLLTGAVLNPEEIVTEKQRQAREWALTQLSTEDKSFIESFQPTVEISLGESSLLCFHGSPASFDEVILPDTPEEDVQRMLGEFLPSITTGGHTHTQFVRRVGDAAFFFNPGSVGVAYNRHHPEPKFHLDTWAEYAVLSVDGERMSLEFRRVPFSFDTFERIVRESGRPNAQEYAAQYRPQS
ncbi:MAG TPA: metallophosphoesterase family protein [Chloroflexia bacterium]|nr:metallophosphoesterase family protein [Chloroflexia bacterium]